MVAVVSALALILLIIVIVQAAKPDKAPVWEPRVHTPPLGPYTTELCKQYTNFNYTQPDISQINEFAPHEDWSLSEIWIY